MQTKMILKLFVVTFFGALLAGCGGSLPKDTTGSSASKAGGSNGAASSLAGSLKSSTSNSSSGPVVLRIGSGVGATFMVGKLTTTTNLLLENQMTTISANIVDAAGALAKTSVDVTFDSECIKSAKSNLKNGNTVASVNGVVTVEYKAGTCLSDDVVTASFVDGGTTKSATVTVTVDSRRLGSYVNDVFTSGALDIGIGSGILTPDGKTAITASVVDSKGALVTEAFSVTFSSPCLTAGTAIITGGNTVAATAGQATAEYTSRGCSGPDGASATDAVKATVSFKTTQLTATSNISVKGDTIQSISFVDAVPQLISIKGTGGGETSVLRFRVLGQTGKPVKGTCVSFAPSTTLGGLALVPSLCSAGGNPGTYNSLTDADGYVSTTVQAGSVPTAVRVTATTSNNLSTQSSALAVTTGLPDQNSISLGVTNLEPVAWDYDGVETKASVRLADAFNNPVPDGTSVSFTTSGGSIDSACSTVKGVCDVTWRSQLPRPQPDIPYTLTIGAGGIKLTCSNGKPECRNGRVKILAHAIGNESFIDGDGSGLYNNILKDIFATDVNRCKPNTPDSSASKGALGGCDDLGEAYVDKNFDGVRDPDEEFIDFNENGTFDAQNGKYDGALCSGTAKTNGDCTTNKVSVRKDALIVMSSGVVNTGLLGPATMSAAAGVANSYTMILADKNGNGLPAGTTLTLKTDALSKGKVSVSPSAALPMSTEPTLMSITLTGTDDPTSMTKASASGAFTLEINATTPSGALITSVLFTVMPTP
jgi:hypothetical protein